MVGQFGGKLEMHPESPFSASGGSMGASWLIGLRVFLDGNYQDPPPEVLPPVPTMQPGENCCNIL